MPRDHQALQKTFIKKKQTVGESDRAASFTSGAAAPPKAAANIVLCGVPGSGRDAVAAALADTLGLRLAEVTGTTPQAALEAFAAGGHVLTVGPEALDSAAVEAALPGLGVVFSMMADARLLQSRLDLEEEESRRLAEAAAAAEPRFLALGGVPLNAAWSVADTVAQAVELYEYRHGSRAQTQG